MLKLYRRPECIGNEIGNVYLIVSMPRNYLITTAIVMLVYISFIYIANKLS